ncbi:hypothetical protein HOD75_01975 [archaeon]|jgi:hypothetical protein|nr:hypothetical protein [archaeon]MBT4241645.1 hypothetical protein [archaeon]MBT4418040.1 hypothetical protein [archaeon]
MTYPTGRDLYDNIEQFFADGKPTTIQQDIQQALLEENERPITQSEILRGVGFSGKAFY